MSPPRRRLLGLAAAAAAALATPGCSLRRLAVNQIAGALAAGGDVWSSDPDPELIREALPFALKTTESLLAEVPEHPGLLLAACSGFTQYGYAFVAADAAALAAADYAAAEAQRDRALGLYLRGRDYCLRGLERAAPGIGEELRRVPTAAAARIDGERIDLLYWTGASWGAAVAAGLHRPDVVADLPAVRALMDRVLALDETYGEGAAHEALIGLEALPPAMGGSLIRAREHFRRAVELARGTRASPYVSLATAVALPAQDRREFEALLRQALAVDPDAVPRLRLPNLLAQRQARRLLAAAGELFLEEPAAD